MIQEALEIADARVEERAGFRVLIREDGRECCYACGSPHRQQWWPPRDSFNRGRERSGWTCGYCGVKAPPPQAP